jgi:hypothetical protein
VQTIWDKTQVLLATSWGMHLKTLWELENPLGTHSEQKKKSKRKKQLCPPYPNPSMDVYRAFPLAA